ncbi:MAG TPA: hypothetical protein VGJ06_01620 [Candidatus Acidoferrum sp.]
MPSTVTAGSAERVPRVNSLSANDLWLEVFGAFNFLCLTGDIALAHSENHFRARAEYVPLWFSLIAAVLLIGALIARLRSNRLGLWNYLGRLVGWASILVGTAGVVYHLDSQFFYERTLKSLTYAAPFSAPAAYIGLGCLILMNRMVSPRSREWSQWVLFFTLGGFAGNFVLSLTDHAVNGFFHWTEWIPVASSAVAVGFLLVLLFLDAEAGFLWWCAGVLLLQMCVGVAGFALHLWADFHGPAANLFANVISGAPPFAPLLFPNLAILGFIGIVAMARDAS